MGDNFLKNILDYKKGLIKEQKAFFSSLKINAGKCDPPHLFMQAITEPGTINLIAEIKKASPSKGIIREDFDPVAIARIYSENRASAISVLTEDKYFLGKPEFIKQISENVTTPILAKDFIIDAGQIYEAHFNGASAVLLITAILSDEKLLELIEVARSLGLDSLVEVHTQEELDRACKAGAAIIGVNNRDLNTFIVDMNTCRTIIPEVPKDKVIVAESGIKTHDDIKEIHQMGAHAVLIGETFMQEQDISKKIKDVMNGQS